MNNKLAATIDLGPKGGFRGFGPLGLVDQDGAHSAVVFQNIISMTIGIITVIAIIWFVVQLLTGAVSIIGSGGDKNKTEQAKAKITSALTGLIVVIAGIFIVDLIGSILGFSILDIAAQIVSLGGNQ